MTELSHHSLTYNKAAEGMSPSQSLLLTRYIQLRTKPNVAVQKGIG